MEMGLHKMVGYRNVLKKLKWYSAAGIPEKIEAIGKQQGLKNLFTERLLK